MLEAKRQERAKRLQMKKNTERYRHTVLLLLLSHSPQTSVVPSGVPGMIMMSHSPRSCLASAFLASQAAASGGSEEGLQHV